MWLVLAVFSGFAAAALAPMVPRRAGGMTGPLLAALPLGLAVCFCAALWSVAEAGPQRVSYDWAPGLSLALSFRLDGLGALFAVLITAIGALVLVYAGGYLPADGGKAGRFYLLLLAFMGCMLGMVLADNLLVLYLFWEGTSLTSYLLIGTDHERAAARAAAWQALLVTGGGGLALLAGLLLLGHAAGTFELSELLARGEQVRSHALYLPALLLVAAGAFTKSAQFPFHFWLPAAMEAPTPVSAYLHSATMVKAGVYLLARLSPVLAGTEAWFWTLVPAGAVTMLAGGYLAVHVTDLKRVLAYSTVSALGGLVLLLGIGTEAAVKAAVVFLVAHALYKGAMFMVAGAVDHEAGTREIDRLGGLRRAMPITAGAAVLAALSLAGLGPMLNFIAKEMLFEAVWAGSARTVLAPVVVAAGAMFVAVAWIVGVRPFFGEPKGELAGVHEAPPSLWAGPAVLALAGIVLGVLPGLVELPLSAAASAVAGRPVRFDLALWHGFNVALLLSALSIALGAALCFGWLRLRRTNPLLERVIGWGPARWYAAGLDALNAAAVAQTRVLQSGYLRYYLLTTLSAAAVLVAAPLLRHGRWWRPPAGPVGLRFYEVALAALILLAAVAAVRARSRLAGVAALGVVGYAVSLLFVLFGAPDLAMTQFLVETLVVILFVLVFHLLPRYTRMSSPGARARDAAVALCGGAVVTALVLTANAFPLDTRLARFFADNSLTRGHGRNIVNVILVDFRGLDTLGEITVLAVAGIGVYALLKLRPPREARGRRDARERQHAGRPGQAPSVPEAGRPPEGREEAAAPVDAPADAPADGNGYAGVGAGGGLGAGQARAGEPEREPAGGGDVS